MLVYPLGAPSFLILCASLTPFYLTDTRTPTRPGTPAPRGAKFLKDKTICPTEGMQTTNRNCETSV